MLFVYHSRIFSVRVTSLGQSGRAVTPEDRKPVQDHQAGAQDNGTTVSLTIINYEYGYFLGAVGISMKFSRGRARPSLASGDDHAASLAAPQHSNGGRHPHFPSSLIHKPLTCPKTNGRRVILPSGPILLQSAYTTKCRPILTLYALFKIVVNGKLQLQFNRF